MFTTEALSTALADRYVIDRLIGEGGMARVFLARDLRHNRRVALKVLRPDLGAVVGVDRFQAEIEVTANLQHPNLLPLFDSGVAGDLFFYVMPYVEGESLRHRIEREKQLPVDEAVRIATAIAGALDYAHRHGVIHRDLKPENVLLQEGQPLVADFGIALAISNAGGSRITQTGLSLGTPQYMSPEQATGDRAIDGRTDVYSLGALTYEMLTGEPPHSGTTSQAVIARVLTERPRSIRVTRPSVPEHVEAAVDQALEKLPADRWTTARDFAEALTGARQVRTTSTTLTRSGAVPRARRIREVAAWAVGGVVVGAVAVWLGTRGAPPAPPAVSAEFEIDLPEGFMLPTAGAAASVAISRDGSTLVFVGQPKGTTQTVLYSRRLGERAIHEIRGTEGGISPTLSPDGKEVLFGIRGSGVTIKRVPIAGGVTQTVMDSAIVNGQVSWREGNQVLIARTRGMILLDVQTGARTVIPRADTTMIVGFPDVLPGGNAALITIKPRNGALDSTFLATMTLPDGKVTGLGIRGLSPKYSAGHVVYATADQLLNAVPFDAKRLAVTGTPVVLAEGVGGGSGGAVPFAVADNGSLTFIQGRAGSPVQTRPVAVNQNGTVRFLGAAAGLYAHPRISPDGKQVAYTSGIAFNGSEVNTPDIWTFDVTTGQSHRMTTERSRDFPVWSRDGTELYFAGIADSTGYAIPASGGQARVLYKSPGGRLWDPGPPHGLALMFARASLGGDLMIANMDSLEKLRVFAAGPYAEIEPRISPDGRFVAFTSGRTGTAEVVVRAITGNEDEVRVSTGGGGHPVWSRDGQDLFWLGGPYSGVDIAADAAQMMTAHVTTTSPKIAFSAPRALFPLRQYGMRSKFDVFPNGDFLLFAAQSDSINSRTAFVVRTNWPSPLGDRVR